MGKQKTCQERTEGVTPDKRRAAEIPDRYTKGQKVKTQTDPKEGMRIWRRKSQLRSDEMFDTWQLQAGSEETGDSLHVGRHNAEFHHRHVQRLLG